MKLTIAKYYLPSGVSLLREKVTENGKIRWIGLSNVSVDELRLAQTLVDVTTVQNRLNPFFREAVAEGVVAECADQGLGFLAYSPVGGGRLNKKLPDHPVLGPIAERHGVSPHAVALAWDLAQGPAVIVIPAARQLAHVADSQAAADIELSSEELEAINQAEFDTN